MSGRTGNHRSRGSTRGRGSKMKGNALQRKTSKKKTLEEYVFYVGTSTQASDYETTAEFLINYVKRTFDRGNDVAETLRNLTKLETETWKPNLKVSTMTDENKREAQNKQFEIEFKAELEEYLMRKRTYEDNLFKAFALIWERCAKAMQNNILARKDYQNQIYNNPINLLKAIKEHSLNYQESRYEMSIISDALRAAITLKQRENENIQEYTRRFKTSKEILEQHLGGPLVLTKYVTKMNGYVAENQEKIKELTNKASDQLFAFIYLENSDQTKYGSILKGLNEQKSLGNDQYPKSIIESTNVLSNHRFDRKKFPKKKFQIDNHNMDNATSEGDESPTLSFAQMEGKCYCCGKPGHKSPQCSKRKTIPREEWAINKTQFMQQGSTSDNNDQANAQQHVGWAGLHCSFAQMYNMRDLILLDSDSSDTVFCNEKYVTNIRPSDEILQLNTNGGIMESREKCDVPRLSTYWFNRNTLTNIISLAHMAEKFRVTYDSNVEKALCVHLPDRIVKFHQLRNNLYALNPSDKNYLGEETDKAQFVNTIEENMRFLSPRQKERVKKAQKLYEAMGTPTMDDLKAMIRMNLIRNNEVTTEDINLAVKTYGPDVGHIKGKTTRQKPSPVTSNLIEIPDELIRINEDIKLSIDGITVNSLKFLTTISHDVFY